MMSGTHQGGSKKLQGVPRKFLECFKEVSRMMQGRFNWVSLTEFSKVFLEDSMVFWEIVRVFEGRFRGAPTDL